MVKKFLHSREKNTTEKSNQLGNSLNQKKIATQKNTNDNKLQGKVCKTVRMISRNLLNKNIFNKNYFGPDLKT